MTNSIRRNELGNYKDLPVSRRWDDCLHFPLDWYEDVDKRNEWNGFVTGNLGRCNVGDVTDMEDRYQFLVFKLEHTLYFGKTVWNEDGTTVEPRKEKRTIYVAARDWDEALRVEKHYIDMMMNSGIIDGWSNC